MKHLSREQLIDVTGGAAAESSWPHLQSCDTCRQQLADLRAMMSVVADVDVPEPSPLFWDHFSSRVHDAVEAERQSATPGIAGWSMLKRPLVWMPGVAVVMLAVAIGTLAGRWSAPALSPSSNTFVAETVDWYDLPDDPSLSLVADLAAELDWDGAAEAGLTTHIGADNDAVMQLSEGERRELSQLLRMELEQQGGQRGA